MVQTGAGRFQPLQNLGPVNEIYRKHKSSAVPQLKNDAADVSGSQQKAQHKSHLFQVHHVLKKRAARFRDGWAIEDFLFCKNDGSATLQQLSEYQGAENEAESKENGTRVKYPKTW